MTKKTIRVIATCFDNSLHLRVDEGTDFDEMFDAICLDTGEQLRVSGWLYTVEILTDEEELH